MPRRTAWSWEASIVFRSPELASNVSRGWPEARRNDHTRRHKYNGTTAPRIVLFSPIAHENLRDPNLPDGSENNQRLAMYTTAMADVANSQGVAFVDLFCAHKSAVREVAAATDDQRHSLDQAGATAWWRKSSMRPCLAKPSHAPIRSLSSCAKPCWPRTCAGLTVIAQPTVTAPTGSARS